MKFQPATINHFSTLIEWSILYCSALDIRQSTDYSPFGVTLHGRNFTASGAEKFRYGFQNQEIDDEVKGEGNSLNFEFRMYDSRLGRFLSEDPLIQSYPSYTPYSFSGNKVIHCRELEGKEEIIATMTPDGNSWVLTWDVTARMRPKEKGCIVYKTNDGQVLEEMRKINTLEMKNIFIASSLKRETTDTRITKPNHSPDRAGGATATCVTFEDGLLCDMLVPLDYACPPVTPVGTGGTDPGTGSGPKIPKKLKMSDSLKKELGQKLTNGGVFTANSNNGGATSTFDVTKGRSPLGTQTIQDIMAPFKKYDLSDVKIDVNLILGSANGNKTLFYAGGPASLAKDVLMNNIANEFVASGILRENIKGTTGAAKSMDVGDIKFSVKVK